jgi:4-hydroxy-2-oxoheptanedioate aldolase
MKNPSIRKRLASGGNALCTRLAYQDTELVELVSRLGVDAVWLCTEHVKLDPSSLRALINATRLGGAEALVRIRPGTYAELIQVLELGATGIMVPWVNSAAEARQIVEQVKFAPMGRRGYDGSHADADYGLKPMREYLNDANENTFVVIQIETESAVEEIEEIASIEGVDVLFLGPNDLSINMGIPGEITHPKIRAIAQRIVEACRCAGKAAGVTCSTPELFKYYHELGFRFISYGSDYRMVRKGYEALIEEAKTAGFPG